MSQSSPDPSTVPLSSVDPAVTRTAFPPVSPARATSAAWQGWAYFGAVIMGLAGFFQAVLGFVALVDEQYFTLREHTLLAASSYATWGWAHLIIGGAALAAGAGILTGGHRWARATGIVVAGLSAVLNLGYLAASPVWSMLIITLDVLVIYALTVHGWEIDNS